MSTVAGPDNAVAGGGTIDHPFRLMVAPTCGVSAPAPGVTTTSRRAGWHHCSCHTGGLFLVQRHSCRQVRQVDLSAIETAPRQIPVHPAQGHETTWPRAPPSWDGDGLNPNLKSNEDRCARGHLSHRTFLNYREEAAGHGVAVGYHVTQVGGARASVPGDLHDTVTVGRGPRTTDASKRPPARGGLKAERRIRHRTGRRAHQSTGCHHPQHVVGRKLLVFCGVATTRISAATAREGVGAPSVFLP